MPDDRLAENLLSLVAPPDRAAAAIGDLLESVPCRGETWFWLSVVRTEGAFIGKQIRQEASRFVIHAVIAWFAYMLVALLLLVAGILVANIAWMSAYVLMNHTGVELVTGWLGWQLQDGWAPPVVTNGVEVFVMAAAAPYFCGRRVVDVWQERAVAFTVILAGVWLMLTTVVPVAGHFGNRVGPRMLAVIVPCILCGVVQQRLTAIRRLSPPTAA